MKSLVQRLSALLSTPRRKHAYRRRTSRLSVIRLEDRTVPAVLDGTSLTGTWSWYIKGQDWFNGSDAPPVAINDGDSGGYQGGTGMDHWGAFASAQVQYLDAAARAGFEATGDDRSETTHAEFSTTQTFVIDPGTGEQPGDKVQIDVPTPTVVQTGPLSFSLIVTGPKTGTIDLSAGGSAFVHIGDTVTFAASGQATDSTSSKAGDYPGLMAHAAFDYVNVGNAILPNVSVGDGDLQVPGSMTSGTVTYNYHIDTDVPAAPIEADFYWATGTTFDTVIGAPAHVESFSKPADLSIGDHDGKQFDVSLLGQRPANATYLLMKMGPDSLRESTKDDNVTAAQLPVSLNVQTDASTDAAPQFGPYLPSVHAFFPFTVLPNDPSQLVHRIRYSVDGNASIPVLQKAGKWLFDFDPGTLNPAKPHTLTVTAYDASGKPLGDPFKGTFDLQKLPLSYDVQAEYPGGPQEEVNDLRFVADVPLHGVVFTGTIGGLPKYYQDPKLLTVDLAGKSETVAAHSDGGNFVFTFTKNADALPVGSDDIIALLGLNRGVVLDKVSSAALSPESVLSIREPAWLKSGPLAKAEFDPQTGDYEFHHARPNLINLQLPTPKVHTGINALDAQIAKFATYARLTPDFDAEVPLNMKGAAPTVIANSLTASVRVLGHSVYEKTAVPPSTLTFGGTLDAKSLDPKGVFVKYQQDLGMTTLFTHQFNLVYPVVNPILSLVAPIQLKVTGDMQVSAGIEIDADANHRLIFNPAGTYIGGSSTLEGTVTVDVKASLLANFAEVKLAHAFLSGKLVVSGKAAFTGPVLSPHLDGKASGLVATLSGDYGFTVLDKNKKTTQQETDTEKKTNGQDPAFGPVTFQL